MSKQLTVTLGVAELIDWYESTGVLPSATAGDEESGTYVRAWALPGGPVILSYAVDGRLGVALEQWLDQLDLAQWLARKQAKATDKQKTEAIAEGNRRYRKMLKRLG